MRVHHSVRLILGLVLGLCVGRFTEVRAQEDAHNREQTLDSAMAISPSFMPVFTAPLPTIYFNTLQFSPEDTSAFHVAEYDPLWQTHNLYQSLGINTQAHKRMVFDYQHTPGFTLITLPYELYFKRQTDLLFYDVKTSYSKLSFTYGISTERIFYATHAQKIGRVDVAVNLYGAGNQGYFMHQGTKMFEMDALVHYKTRNNIYGFTASYILNHAKFSENGGLENDRLFIDREVKGNTTASLHSYNVSLSSASSRINTHDVQFMQYVNIRDKKGHKFGTLTHTVQYMGLESSYEDLNVMGNPYYPSNLILRDTMMADTLEIHSVVNSLQWSNYEPFDTTSQKNYFFRIAGGIRHEYMLALFPDPGHAFHGNAFTLFGRTAIRLFKVWDISGCIDYSFNSYIRNDAAAHVLATFAISRRLKHFIGLSADFYRVAPDGIYSFYFGSNGIWVNDWKKENNLKLGAYWTILDYKLGFNYFMMNNHLFLNSDFVPEVSEMTANIVQLNLFAPVRVRNFYMDVNMSLQHSTDACIQVPLFAGKLYAAYCFRIFRNRLRMQVGGDLMYNTLYYADGYCPMLRQFYVQKDTKVGNYLYFDANITMQVDRLAFFARVGNILAGAFGYTYFTTPDYPMQGRNFQFGITWRFYD